MVAKVTAEGPASIAAAMLPKLLARDSIENDPDLVVKVRRMIETAHDQAWDILVEYRDVLDNLVLELME